MAEHRLYNPKDIIFREGDESDYAYLIVQGKVEILKHAPHGEILLATLKKGDIFGEMGIFDPRSPRSATARAIEGTELDPISPSELAEMVNQCPPRLIPIVNTVLERLRATNKRVSNAEQATVILDSDIERIVIEPASEALQNQFEPVEYPVARLPYKIGGYAMNDEPDRHAQNHLNLRCEGPPLIVSNQHCQIAVEERGIYLVDTGSRHCTMVNGKIIGRGKGQYRLPLQKGANEVVLGGRESPYKLRVTCK